jgi:hypothetical protein
MTSDNFVLHLPVNCLPCAPGWELTESGLVV